MCNNWNTKCAGNFSRELEGVAGCIDMHGQWCLAAVISVYSD